MRAGWKHIGEGDADVHRLRCLTSREGPMRLMSRRRSGMCCRAEPAIRPTTAGARQLQLASPSPPTVARACRLAPSDCYPARQLSSAGRSPLRFIEGQAAGVASLGRTPDVPPGSASTNGQRVSRPRPSSSARASYGREADRQPEFCSSTSLVEVLTFEPATSASRPLALRLSGRLRTVSPRSRLATGVDR